MSTLTNGLGDLVEQLRSWADTLESQSARQAVATPEDIMGILSAMLRANRMMQQQTVHQQTVQQDPGEASTHRDPHIDPDPTIAGYRGAMQRIRELLPQLEARLLEERARLETEQARIRATMGWAQTSRRNL